MFEITILPQNVLVQIFQYVLAKPFDYCGESLLTIDWQSHQSLSQTSRGFKDLADRALETLIGPPKGMRTFDWGRLKQTAAAILEEHKASECLFITVGTSFPLTVFLTMFDPDVQCAHLITPEVGNQKGSYGGIDFKPPKTQLPANRKLVILDWSGIDLFLVEQFFKSELGGQFQFGPPALTCLRLENDYPDLWPVYNLELGTIAWLATQFLKTPKVGAENKLPSLEHISVRKLGKDSGDPSPRFGTEMTFTNETLTSGKPAHPITEKNKWREAMEALGKVRKNANGSPLFTVGESSDLLTDERHPQVSFPGVLGGKQQDDWWYQITTDSKVIELKTKPMTLVDVIKLEKVLVEDAEHLKLMDLIQTLIFDVGKEKLGLEPHSALGAGHIHIDIESAFMSNPIMLLNFMTDIHNLGVWPFLQIGHQYSESAPLSLLPEESIKAYGAIVKAIQKESATVTCDTLLQRIRDTVYIHSRNLTLEKASVRDLPSIQKYQTLALTKVSKTDKKHFLTIELRAMRPQSCATELRRMLELLHNRIVYATERERVVEFAPPQANRRAANGESKPEKYEDIIKRFFLYAQEAKVEPNDYLDYFPPEFKAGHKRWMASLNKPASKSKGTTPPK